MSRLLKYLGMLVVAVLGLALAGGAGLWAWTNGELAEKGPVPTHEFKAPAPDSAVLARGEHLTKAIAKCADCHGADYGGFAIINDPAIGLVYAPNLTSGRGGVLAAMSDADIERAVRHGIAADGRRLVVMPSNEYQLLSDEDLGLIITYLRSLPAVDRDPTPMRIGPLARVLYATGKLPLFPADAVTHGSEVVASVTADSTVAYGKYLADGGCSGCHGAGYSGGRIPGTPPDWPPAANLTPTGMQEKNYDYAGFVKALTDGVRPDGTQIHPVMPVNATKLMTPVEMRAIWKYLETVAPKETGGR